MSKCNMFLAVATVCASVQLASAGVYQPITVDGNVSDWAGIAPAYTDASGDTNGSTGAVDFTKIYIANDANFLYFRFQLAQAANPQGTTSNFFINTDNNSGTGYQPFGDPAVGSEILIQGDQAYQQSAGGFNVGQLDSATNSKVQVGNYSATATDGFEFRISRSATMVSGNVGSPFFGPDGSTITLTLQNDGSGDIAGPISYTFAAVPEPASFGLIAFSAVPLLRRRRGV